MFSAADGLKLAKLPPLPASDKCGMVVATMIAGLGDLNRRTQPCWQRYVEQVRRRAGLKY